MVAQQNISYPRSLLSVLSLPLFLAPPFLHIYSPPQNPLTCNRSVPSSVRFPAGRRRIFHYSRLQNRGWWRRFYAIQLAVYLLVGCRGQWNFGFGFGAETGHKFSFRHVYCFGRMHKTEFRFRRKLSIEFRFRSNTAGVVSDSAES